MSLNTPTPKLASLHSPCSEAVVSFIGCRLMSARSPSDLICSAGFFTARVDQRLVNLCNTLIIYSKRIALGDCLRRPRPHPCTSAEWLPKRNSPKSSRRYPLCEHSRSVPYIKVQCRFLPVFSVHTARMRHGVRYTAKSHELTSDLTTSALILFEYLLTIHQEVRLFWGKKPTGAIILFFANRYTTIIVMMYAILINLIPVASPNVQVRLPSFSQPN